MLRFAGLSKSFGRRSVIENARLDLTPGIYALQGPNGIGKSTLLSLLAGALPLDAGSVSIAGASLAENPIQARQRLSYVPDESPIYPFVTGREFLYFVAHAKQASVDRPVIDLVHGFGLDPQLDVRFSAMSLGTQKKFLLCAAWIGDPSVLLMDEPSNGLDKDARSFLALLLKKSEDSKVILFTSHDADFVSSSGAEVLSMDRIFSRRQ